MGTSGIRNFLTYQSMHPATAGKVSDFYKKKQTKLCEVQVQLCELNVPITHSRFYTKINAYNRNWCGRVTRKVDSSSLREWTIKELDRK